MRRYIVLIIAVLAMLSAQARQPGRGYRGFVEWSNSLTSEDAYGMYGSRSETRFYTGASTSHGYQFNPALFVGAGLTVEGCGDTDRFIVPLFVQVRTDRAFGRFTLFGDLRFGYNMADGGGIYLSPTVGNRFNWGRKVGINVGIGLTLRGHKVNRYDVMPGEQGLLIVHAGDKRSTDAMFAFRIGMDF